MKQINELQQKFENASPEVLISWFLKEFDGKVVFASGMGAEDQVITHMIASIDTNARIFTLDTGRLFQETYDLIHVTEQKYGLKIEVIFPDTKKVEDMVREKGINLFYESIENRKLCCGIRKTESLKRALEGMDAWICGLRKEQSQTRQHLRVVERDESHGLIKVNPLINWNWDEVWDYIRKHNIPYNKLHDKGFTSIGCLPCTRAIKPGEDLRTGRWWWEMGGHKECGLHVNE